MYTVVTRAIAPNGKPLWFGCVMSKKSAVTYHLIPLYYNPKLLKSMPRELAPRMQGKTCFNFQRPDADLFAMIDELTQRGREQWEQAGFLKPGQITPEMVSAALRSAGGDPDAVAKQRTKVTSAAARKRRETLRRRGKSPVATGNR